MKRPWGCFGRGVFIMFGLVAVTIAVGSCGYFYLRMRNRERNRRLSESPIVYITEPSSGEEVPAGGYINVLASAMGHTPITRMELWLDGELVDTQTSDKPEGLSPLFAIFGLPVPQGPHLVIVRAVNLKGIIGQSIPVDVFGKQGAGGEFKPVLANGSDTLAEIAQSNNTDLPTLQNLNPSLGSSAPVAGSFVKVPPPPKSPGSSPVQLPDTAKLKVVEPSLLAVIVAVLNPVLVQPPAAPSDLLIQVAGCKITLRWNDIANNEEYYEVWVAGTGITPHAIYQLNPAGRGLVWFEFPAPKPGNLSFWVEAVNPIGRQPSNLVGTNVSDVCPSTTATQIRIELLEINASASYDKAYCYLSIEGAPHIRLPQDSSAFLQIQAGQANISTWELAKRQFVMPIPADGSIEIAGECWGWSGGKLNKVGTFAGTFPVETWDGSKRSLQAGSFQLVFAFQPLGATDAGGTKTTYANNDPGIPVPYNLRLWTVDDWDYYDQRLLWDWNGNPKDIIGFRVYLNGMPYALVTDIPGQISSLLPYGCSHHVRWEVAAVTSSTQSALSAPLEYDLPRCAIFAIVKFKYITIQSVSSGGGFLPTSFNPCDTVGTYFAIYVNNISRKAGYWYADMWSGPKDAQVTCGTYTFDQLLRQFPDYKNQPEPDTFRVMIRGDNLSLTFAARFMFDNGWGESTTLLNRVDTISMPYEQWKTYKNTFNYFGSGNQTDTVLTIEVRTEMEK